MSDTKLVRVKILPLHNIGGIGNAGDVVTMSKAHAEMYVRDGYVEYAADADPILTLPSLLKNEKQQEDHKIMKPQAKRAKKRK